MGPSSLSAPPVTFNWLHSSFTPQPVTGRRNCAGCLSYGATNVDAFQGGAGGSPTTQQGQVHSQQMGATSERCSRPWEGLTSLGGRIPLSSGRGPEGEWEGETRLWVVGTRVCEPRSRGWLLPPHPPQPHMHPAVCGQMATIRVLLRGHSSPTPPPATTTKSLGTHRVMGVTAKEGNKCWVRQKDFLWVEKNETLLIAIRPLKKITFLVSLLFLMWLLCSILIGMGTYHSCQKRYRRRKRSCS